MKRVFIAGIGETKFGKMPEISIKSLIKEAGEKAILDSKLDKGCIQALFISNFNSAVLCNQNHLGPMASEVLQLGNIPTLRVEGACASGSLAFKLACQSIQSEEYNVVLVGGVEKMTHQPTEIVTRAISSAMNYEEEALVGATFPSIFAMIANRYKYEFTDPRPAMTYCAIKNHENAMANPDAHLHKRINEQDISKSVIIASPLTLYDCSLISDGAVFIVLTSEDIARHLGDSPRIELVGSGHSGDSLSFSSRAQVTKFQTTIEASRKAYAQANIRPGDIDVAEVHDCFTITEIINVEDLGFFPKGKGVLAILEGKTNHDGMIPINQSGGLKAKGHPIGATGLSQIYEITKQLRGEAGVHQVKNPIFGLSHNLGGAGATCVVNILRRNN